jgi:hypothetical protein
MHWARGQPSTRRETDGPSGRWMNPVRMDVWLLVGEHARMG